MRVLSWQCNMSTSIRGIYRPEYLIGPRIIDYDGKPVDDLPFVSGGSSDVVALDFTETEEWSRTLEELSQP